MATIKLKYRQSSVQGKDGILFYQIIQMRQVRQLYTDLHISDNEWDIIASAVIIPSKTSPERIKYLLTIQKSLKEWISKLSAIVEHFDRKGLPYTADDVVAAYNKPLAIIGVISFTRKLIDEMNKICKKATVKRFSATMKSLLRYTGGEEVIWPDITSTFIIGYEEFLMKRGLCRNSTSFYMRNLRAILNRATEQDYEVSQNLFKHVYMGVDKTVKRAVPLDVVCRIRDIDLADHPALDFARKVFMFAFYTRGMSLIDIAFLKKSDQNNGVITYYRRKTRQQLTVRIEPETRKLIESFGNNNTSFLLPIITNEERDVGQQYENAYYRINRNLQKVGKMLGLDTKLTLYVARHAWASIAHSNNVALSTISRAMGHDSEKTTVIYLQSLDMSSVDKANSDIIRMMDGRKMGKMKQ